MLAHLKTGKVCSSYKPKGNCGDFDWRDFDSDLSPLRKGFCKIYLVQGDGWWLSEKGKYKQSEKGKYRQSCVVSFEATAVDAARLAARPRSSVPGQTYPYSTYSLENFQPRGIMKNKHWKSRHGIVYYTEIAVFTCPAHSVHREITLQNSKILALPKLGLYFRAKDHFWNLFHKTAFYEM